MDSRRSWEVAAACCWINAFSLLLLRSSSIVYVGTLQTFDVTREDASWPLSLVTTCFCFTGPIVGALASYIAIPKLMLVGSVATALAVSACYFANGVSYLIVFLGIVQGCAISVLGLCNTAINQHFHRYRAVASGVNNAGFCIGGLVFPPLVQLLFDEYGCRGALLICGAVMLNATAGAFLTRSPLEPSVKDNYSNHQNAPFSDIIASELNLQHEFTVDSKQSKKHQTRDNFNSKEHWKKPVRLLQESTVPLVKNGCALEVQIGQLETSHEKYKTIAPKGENLHASLDTFGTGVADTSKAEQRNVKNRGQKGRLGKLHFLLSPKFYLVAVSLMQIWFNTTVYLTVVVDFATDRNISKWNAVFLVTCNTAADLVARLGSGFITDKRLLSRNSMMAVHLLVWAGMHCLMPLCTSYAVHVFVSIIMGWCNGSTFILMPVFFMEVVRPDAFSMCMGVAYLVAGLPLMARPVLIGYYRDTRGDYEGLFNLQGMVSAGIAVFWIFASYKERRRACSHSQSVCDVQEKETRS